MLQVHSRIQAAREELLVIEEQLRSCQESTDEARVRALVSETPLADRELIEARRHMEAMSKSRDAIRNELAKLELAQTELLDQLPVEGL